MSAEEIADPASAPSRDQALARIKAIIDAALPFIPLVVETEPPASPKRASRKGKRKGERVEDAAAGKGEDGGGGDPPEAPPAEPSDGGDDGDDSFRDVEWEPENDVGNAKRLLFHFGADLLFVYGIGWHVWAKSHWHRDGAEHEARRLGQQTAARIKLERPMTKAERAVRDRALALRKKPAKERTPAERGEILEWLKLKEGLQRTGTPRGRWLKRAAFSVSSGNSGKIKGMLEQAEPHKMVQVEALDRDALSFNVANGTLRFYAERDEECPDPDVVRLAWRVRLDAHERGDLISRAAPVAYEPGAACPQWDAFLARVQPIERVRSFLQMWNGYSLTGLTDAQAFLFHWGGGANGKSSFIECLWRLLGPYGGTLNPESFTGTNQRRGDQATPDLADLVNVRALRISELPQRAKLQDNLIKAVTGGEPMKVRQLNQPFFTFRPIFKPQMSGNAKPSIDDISEGMWRRLFLVPWTVTIPKEDRRGFEEMQAVFEAEWPGILNWLIEGCIRYLETRRFTAPEEVVEATSAHRDALDHIGQFVSASLVRAPGRMLGAGELYEYYSGWCQDSGIRPWSKTAFGIAMPQHQLEGEPIVKGPQGHDRTIKYFDLAVREGAVPRAPPERFGKDF